MKTQLLKKKIVFIPIAIAMFFFSATQGQIVYTDVIPDHVNSCTSSCGGGGLPCTETYNIDINQDGQDDFTLTTFSGPGIAHPFNFPCSAKVSALGLNGNEVSFDNTNQALATDANLEISNGTWTSNTAYLKSVFGGTFSGLWPESVVKYLGVRLLIGGNYYYGWIRLSISVTASVHAACTTKDFAYNSVPDSSILAGQTSVTGISTPEIKNQFSVFPNPASDKIKLSFSSSEKKEIQITNALGQIVFAGEINSTKEEIDVSEFPEGMYIVSAQTATQKIERKFLKQ